MTITPDLIRLLLVLPVGYLLDLCFGDPHWMPHPVRLMGWLIAKLETAARRLFPSTKRGELVGGGLLAAVVTVTALLLPAVLLVLARLVSPWLSFGLESFMCYQILATRSLRDESMKVYERLRAQDLPGARKAVSMIVGRDTAELSFPQVAKAAVETVAENTCDGVVAPLFYLALGGAPLGFLYKSINTMDSMIGYQNQQYQYLGRTAARLDDGANYIPARFSAWMLIAASGLTGLDARGARRIYLRDRRNHASPNSAHTEAAAAGALGVQLAGDASYGGILHKKKTMGDPLRPIEAEDIPRTNRLMYCAAFLSLAVLCILRWTILNLLL